MSLANSSDFVQELASGVKAGDVRSLAKAITLLESQDSHKKTIGFEILTTLKQCSSRISRKIGFTGPPGVGKSTLIENIGLSLINQGFTLAVLTIDPSSPLSGGAILGDKTRMQRLSASPDAFIRPSSSGKGYLGGINAAALDTMDLIEAAGYDFILVETIGIGQNEVDIKNLVDQLILLLPPTAGDELQVLKKGIMEVVDLIVVNKHAGALEKSAKITATHYESALSLLPGNGGEVILCSALDETEIFEIIEKICLHAVSPESRQEKQIELLDKLAFQDLFDMLVQSDEINRLMAAEKLAIKARKKTLRQAVATIRSYLESRLGGG